MEIYLPLVTGLIGAIIGAASSVITIVIQTRIADKRERVKMITELALQDQKNGLEVAIQSGKPNSIMPLVTFIHYHSELVKLLENDQLTPENLAALSKKNETVLAQYEA